jgi:ABC-type transporter Mla subunit MlaD
MGKAVNGLVANLAEALPNVVTAATDMRALSGDFIKDVSRSVAQINDHAEELRGAVSAALRLADASISTILVQSQDALSSLQFQDPVSQTLCTLVKEVNESVTLVREVLAGVDDAEQLDDVPPDSDAERFNERLEHHLHAPEPKLVQSAGDVVLF